MVRALVVRRGGETVSTEIEDLPESELGDGEVLVDVAWSSLNYKDGLALSGSPGVMRVDPLVPGIDAVGTVIESTSGRWVAGDEVVLTGAGLGETRHGGYAERLRVPGDALVRVPTGLGARRTAALGTAGFTAAEAVLALEAHGIPDGPVLVTGATGGVGSVAVLLLAAAGHEVVAMTGRPDESGWLLELGAAELLDRHDFEAPGKPLQSTRWAATVDGAGGAILHNVLAQTVYGGAVAACGLVQSGELHTTVHPFILRGVGLLGINSVFAPLALREAAWARLARDVDPAALDGLTAEVALDGVAEAGARILDGALRGRTVVRVPD